MNFKHIKENYTKSHAGINPRAITPMGPVPDVESNPQLDWENIQPGEVQLPE
ncbi:putative Glutathione S-transferase omega-like 2 [Glarea lozoyensis 74030]|nr:putative Glutathione S-transferase omega-like 2 [Glarea lozoyensis 74030]